MRACTGRNPELIDNSAWTGNASSVFLAGYYDAAFAIDRLLSDIRFWASKDEFAHQWYQVQYVP